LKALNKLSDEYQGETQATVLINIKNKAFIEISKTGE
jgi:hypothetical protein